MTESIARLRSRLAEIDPEQEWHRYRDTGRKMPGVSASSAFRESAAAASVDGSTPLLRKAVDYSAHTLDDGRVQLELTGLKFAVSSSLAGRLDELGPGAATTAADLLGDVPAERSQKFAKALVRMGLFDVAA